MRLAAVIELTEPQARNYVCDTKCNFATKQSMEIVIIVHNFCPDYLLSLIWGKFYKHAFQCTLVRGADIKLITEL